MNDSQQPKKMTMQSNGYPDLGSDEANEAEDICADDDRLLLSILFDHSNGTNENTSVDYSSLAPPIWLHVLCGLPIWFGCTTSVRAFVRWWFIRQQHSGTSLWFGIQSSLLA